MLKALKIAAMFLDKTSGKSEKEVEKLLKVYLPETPFAGKAKVVGGYVRDEYLKSIKEVSEFEPDDLDVVVAPVEGYVGKGAETLTKLLHNEFPENTTNPHNMGKEYPIWQIIFRNGAINYKGNSYATDGAKIEFADAMKETYPDPESRQRKVEPATLEEDIERRDFTVNCLLKDLTTGEIEDLTGVSREDIKKGILKGHPKVSWDTMFSNDPLRMLRLIRFQVKYGWTIPREMIRAVKRNADRIKIISQERIKKELSKIAEVSGMKKAIKFLSLTGLLQHVLPEIEALKGVSQGTRYHQEGDVYKHTLRVLENAKPGIENQMAALLHDVGKPSTRQMIEEKVHFYNHEDIGADIARAIMTRLEFDRKTVDSVVHRVKNHMRPHNLAGAKDLSERALRKFMREVGDETIDAIIDLAEADELGSLPNKNAVPDLRKKIDEIRSAPIKIQKKSILNGEEIMTLLKIGPGPEVKKVQEFLKDLADDYASEGKELTKEIAEKAIKDKF